MLGVQDIYSARPGGLEPANASLEDKATGSYETVLVQNPKTGHTALADRIVRRVEGVVIARAYSLLEYNVPSEKLAEAERITPGFNSPTVSRLENENWHSVRAMVKRGEVIEIMEQLESLGATAILETAIANCRL